MIKSYRDRGTFDIARGAASKHALRALPKSLHEKARAMLSFIGQATSLIDLSSVPSWNIEKLRANRAGQYSIRINIQYRICFEWNQKLKIADNVEITDYH